MNMVRDAYGSRSKEATLIVSFQGELYAIPGKYRAYNDCIDHDIECPTAKHAYDTYEDAKRALRQKSPEEQHIKRIYRCEICGCYHFTTNDGEKLWHPKGYDRSRQKKLMNGLRDKIRSGEIPVVQIGNPDRMLVVRGSTLSSFRESA